MGQMCHDKHTESISFPDAELAEDGVEQVFRRGFANNLTTTK